MSEKKIYEVYIFTAVDVENGIRDQFQEQKLTSFPRYSDHIIISQWNIIEMFVCLIFAFLIEKLEF